MPCTSSLETRLRNRRTWHGEPVEEYHCIELRVSARHSISGKQYWERAQENDGSYHRIEEDWVKLRHDFETAVAAHGKFNVRVVKVTKTVVDMSTMP